MRPAMASARRVRRLYFPPSTSPVNRASRIGAGTTDHGREGAGRENRERRPRGTRNHPRKTHSRFATIFPRCGAKAPVPPHPASGRFPTTTSAGSRPLGAARRDRRCRLRRKDIAMHRIHRPGAAPVRGAAGRAGPASVRSNRASRGLGGMSADAAHNRPRARRHPYRRCRAASARPPPAPVLPPDEMTTH